MSEFEDYSLILQEEQRVETMMQVFSNSHLLKMFSFELSDWVLSKDSTVSSPHFFLLMGCCHFFDLLALFSSGPSESIWSDSHRWRPPVVKQR